MRALLLRRVRNVQYSSAKPGAGKACKMAKQRGPYTCGYTWRLLKLCFEWPCKMRGGREVVEGGRVSKGKGKSRS